MTRQEAMAFMAEHGDRYTEAMRAITDRANPEHPLGVVESEAKQADQESGTGAQSECEPENGVIAAPAPTCRECGVELSEHEAERAQRLPTDTKYHGVCNECALLKAGLL